eukprot:COSAG01_NODE_4470_length_4997_cov_5.849326_4_plen_57_part_00
MRQLAAQSGEESPPPPPPWWEGSAMPAQWMRRMERAICSGEHPPFGEMARSILGPD